MLDTTVLDTPAQPRGDSVQSQVSSVDGEYKTTISILIAHAPASEDVLCLEKIMRSINALKNQLCHKNRKWDGLDIVVQPYAITKALSWITDTADSPDPLQPYHLVILLLSLDFVGSEFCYCEQMETVFKNHQNGKRLLCVPLSECPLEGYPFDLLSEACYLPPMQRPISSWEREGEAYREVYNGIRSTIEHWRLYR